MFKKLLLWLCACAIFSVATGEIFFRKGAPHVKLASGDLLSGTVKFSRDGRPFSSFLGVPYASVSERFADPELISGKQWEGVRSAGSAGPMCPQKMLPAGGYVGEEDCLSLNVHVPMNNTGKKGYPVMVWIHGGGFVYGGGAGYGGKYLMDEDVILVTINYRLGIFGFLSTGDEHIPGNQGLKDQVIALRWVQENIKKFGGNPSSVTIFGESAGGASVHYLTLSPLAQGLFHRAIAQSGSALAVWAHEAYPRQKAVQVATYLNCPTSASDPASITSEEIATCLRSKTTDEINEAQFSFRQAWPLNLIPLFFGPTSEPESTSPKHTPFLTKSPWSITKDNSGKSLSDVPIIFGATEDEGTDLYASVVVGNEALRKEMNSDWSEVLVNGFLLHKHTSCPENQVALATKLREFYFGKKEVSKETEEQLINMYSDGLVLHPTHTAAVETAAKSKKPVYLYQFAHLPPAPLMTLAFGGPKIKSTKVGHADELPILFDVDDIFPAAKDLIEPDSEDEVFSKHLIKLWTSFAKHGEPKYTWGNVLKWNPISKKEVDGTDPLKLLRLHSNPQIIEDRAKDRIAFWNSVWEQHILSGKDSKGKTEL